MIKAPHSLNYWADVVAELANRRTPVWHDRLGRDVEYNRVALGNLARAAHRADVAMDVQAAMQTVERGLLRIEMLWQVEWNIRQQGGSRA